MARTGIDYEKVAEAAEKIAAQDRNPTVESVRRELGSGSNGTIGPLLKRWKISAKHDEQLGGLPADVVSSIKGLYEQLKVDASKPFEDEMKAMADKYNELLEQNGVFQKEIVEKQGLIESLNSDIEMLKRDLSSQVEEASRRRADHAKQLGISERLDVEILSSEKRINALEIELSNCRTHYLHFEEQSMSQQQELREKHFSAIRVVENEKRDLEESVRTLGAEKQSLVIKIGGMSDDLHTFKEKNERLANELGVAASKLKAQTEASDGILKSTRNQMNEIVVNANNRDSEYSKRLLQMSDEIEAHRSTELQQRLLIEELKVKLEKYGKNEKT